MKLQALRTTTGPAQRGHEIGTAFAAPLHKASSGYLRHFEQLGIPSARVRDIVERSRAALRQWAPHLVAESDAAAAAAGIAPWRVSAIGSRTEVLAVAPSAGEGECTTAVHIAPDGPPATIQTWDWHGHLAPDGLLLQLVTDSGRAVKLFTEFGATAKIGVNDAGLGLHFNILSHRSDSDAGGVPVHAIARRVLEEAVDVDDAVRIAESATVSASTVLTVATWHDGVADAASIEMSPAGVAVIRPADDGWLLHTNHFLDPALRDGDTIDAASSTRERYAHARRVRAQMVGRSPADRARAFCGAEGADAAVCVRTDPAQPAHLQWETLMTIALDIPGFALLTHPGPPAEVAAAGLDRF